jgi:hypothetical protein
MLKQIAEKAFVGNTSNSRNSGDVYLLGRL